MTINEYNRQLTNLNARIRLLKDKINLLKTLKNNNYKIYTQDYNDCKELLKSCYIGKRLVKSNTSIDSLYKTINSL